jgi:hypothetical protein
MRRFLQDGVGQPDDLGGQAPLAGFQDPPVGVSKAGEVKVQKLLESVLGLIEAGLELVGRRPQRRDGGLVGGGHDAARIAQQRLARGRVGGDAPGLQHRVRLARAQAVARHRVRQARLLPARQRRKRGGRGGGQPTGVDARGHVGREPAAEGEATIDPGPTAAEERGDLRRREMIVVDQRAHHTRLVHGAQGPAGRVGVEQAGLGHDAGGLFHDDRDVRVALAGPLGQALEAIEHLVGPVGGGRHAQGQRGERAGEIGARASQRRQRRRELRERQVEHARHGRAASTGRSW